jgi:hypothetical protein
VDLSLVLAVQVFRCWVYFFISLSLSAFVCGYLSEDLSRNKWAKMCEESSLGKIFLDLGLFLIWSRKGHIKIEQVLELNQFIFIFHLVTHQMHYILNLLGQLYIFILVNNLNFLLKQPLGQYMLALIER